MRIVLSNAVSSTDGNPYIDIFAQTQSHPYRDFLRKNQSLQYRCSLEVLRKKNVVNTIAN